MNWKKMFGTSGDCKVASAAPLTTLRKLLLLGLSALALSSSSTFAQSNTASQSCVAPAPGVCTPAPRMIEYRGKASTAVAGNHFITSCQEEITTLDRQTTLWERTGFSIALLDPATATGTAVNRFKILLPDEGNVSHFYTNLSSEVALVVDNFINKTPRIACRDGESGGRLTLLTGTDAAGFPVDASQCPAGSTPVWRVLKQVAGAPQRPLADQKPQHRFLTDFDEVDRQVNDGTGQWTNEQARACAPDAYALYTTSVSMTDSNLQPVTAPPAAGSGLRIRAVIVAPSLWPTGTFPTKAMVRFALPAGISYVSASTFDPTACKATLNSKTGTTIVECTLGRPATAIDAVINVAVTGAYNPRSLTDRRIGLSATTEQGLGVTNSPLGCTGAGAPHVSCSTLILPAPLRTVQMRVQDLATEYTVAANTLLSQIIRCANSASSTEAATNPQCSANPVPAGFRFECATPPSSLAPGQSFNCTLSGQSATAVNQVINVTATATNQTTTTAAATTSLSVSAPPAAIAASVILTLNKNTVSPADTTAEVTYVCENTGTQSLQNVTCALTGLPTDGFTQSCTPTTPASLATGQRVTCVARKTAASTAGVYNLVARATATGLSAVDSASQTFTVRVVDDSAVGFTPPANLRIDTGSATVNGGVITGELRFEVTNVSGNVLVGAAFYPEYKNASGGWSSAAVDGRVAVQQVSGASAVTFGAPFSLPQSAISGSSVEMRICATRASGISAGAPCTSPSILSAGTVQVPFNAPQSPATLSIVQQPGAIPLSGAFSFSVRNNSTSAVASGLACGASPAASGYSISCSPSTASAGVSIPPSSTELCRCNVSGSAASGATPVTTFIIATANGFTGVSTGILMTPDVVVQPPAGVNLAVAAIDAAQLTLGSPATIQTTIRPGSTSGDVFVYYEIADATVAAANRVWKVVEANSIIDSSAGELRTLQANTALTVSRTLPSNLLYATTAVRVCVLKQGFSTSSYNTSLCVNTHTGTPAASTDRLISAQQVVSVVPPAEVSVAIAAPTTSLAVGGVASWQVTVSSLPLPATPYTGPLVATLNLPTGLVLDSSAPSTCTVVGGSNPQRVRCDIQSSGALAVTPAIQLAVPLRAIAGSGGVGQVVTVVLKSDVDSGSACANGMSGTGCAKAPAVTPTFYDFVAPAAGSVTAAQLPTASQPLTLSCSLTNNTGVAVPAANASAPTECQVTVTYTGNATPQTIKKPFVSSVASNSTSAVVVCAPGSNDTACTATLNSSTAIDKIAVEVVGVPVLDNAPDNHATRLVYSAAPAPQSCSDRGATYQNSLTRLPQNSSGGMTLRFYPLKTNDVFSVQVSGTDLMAIVGSAAQVGIEHRVVDIGAFKEIVISKCRGDFTSSDVIRMKTEPALGTGGAEGFVRAYIGSQRRQAYDAYNGDADVFFVPDGYGTTFWINFRVIQCGGISGQTCNTAVSGSSS